MELITNLTPEEVKSVIDKSSKKWTSSSALFSSRKRLFFGEIDNCEFKLYRHIKYRNSFLPIAYGRIESDGFGSKIIIRISMDIFTILFMFVWLSISFINGIDSIQEYRGIGSLIPVVFFIFGYVLMSFSFWLEMPKLTQLIKNMLGI